MTTRRLFVAKAALAGAEVVVDGEAHHHLARVLRTVRGDLVCLFDGEGGEADGRVVAIDKQQTRMVVEERRTRPVPKGARLVLCQALIRPEPMDWIVQKATELGVNHIVPTVCARSQGHGRERQTRWERIAQEAARQCGRPDVPQIAEVTPWLTMASEHGAPAAAPEGAFATQRVVLWEDTRESAPLGEVLRKDAREIVLAIGPEGGLETSEVDAARAYGFLTAGLGPRVLRAETAALAALTLAQSVTGGLG